MNAPRELAQLLESQAQLVRELVEHRADLGVGDARANEAELQRQAHERLLRAVVEIALDLLPRRVGGLDDSGARGGKLALRALAVGDVAHERIAAVFVTAFYGCPMKPAVGAVPVQMTLLVDTRLDTRAQGLEVGSRGRAVVRMHELDERPREQLLLREAERPLERRVHALVVAVVAEDAEHVDGEVEESLELGLSSAHRAHDYRLLSVRLARRSRGRACRGRPAPFPRTRRAPCRAGGRTGSAP